jgi:RNA polymerase sigma-70 factor (ECF subfamily)
MDDHAGRALSDLATERVGGLSQPNFADFYRLQREPIFRALALTLRNHDLAADAVEEAMTRAYERWRAVSGFANQEGWVFRVGLNWARSRARKTRREVTTSLVPEGPVHDQLPDPDLDRALGKLSVDARTVIVLRHFLDMSYDQIATALQIPAGTAKSRVHYATEELRRNLEVPA